MVQTPHFEFTSSTYDNNIHLFTHWLLTKALSFLIGNVALLAFTQGGNHRIILAFCGHRLQATHLPRQHRGDAGT